MENEQNSQKDTKALHIGGVIRRLFTVEDIDACWDYYKEYLVDILNGEYKIEDAREDLASLIGTKHDDRNGT